MNKKMLRRKLRRGGWAIALACVALSAGAIVLLRAPGHGTSVHSAAITGTSSAPLATSGGATRAPLVGPSLSGHLAVSQHALLADGPGRLLAELRVTADEDALKSATRQPVALAVVLDVSGSMRGEKLEQAKGAVRQLVERMEDEDQIAFVTYDHTTQVIQALARVGDVRGQLYSRIAAISSGGGTVIPQALEQGAQMLASAESDHVRRLVLLSDGLDGSGVGVQTVASQTRARSSHGVFTSSLGIGTDYDEQFMTAVADAGRGNYEFLASGAQLQAFLHRELEQASATVIEQLVATVTLPEGVRLSGSHGAEVAQEGNTLRVDVGSLFAGDSRRAVLDLAVSPGSTAAAKEGLLGALSAEVSYRTIGDKSSHRLESGPIGLHLVRDEAEAKASRDEEIYASTWAAVIDSEQRRAVEAWRRGDVEAAQRIGQSNSAAIARVVHEAPAAAPALRQQQAEYAQDLDTFGAVSADSARGRGYGLSSNATRRARALH